MSSWDGKREVSMVKACLPIYRYKRRILDTVKENPATLLMAETGAGKSTQVVQYLHNLFKVSKKNPLNLAYKQTQNYTRKSLINNFFLKY
jgi:hypothetical protein